MVPSLRDHDDEEQVITFNSEIAVPCRVPADSLQWGTSRQEWRSSCGEERAQGESWSRGACVQRDHTHTTASEKLLGVLATSMVSESIVARSHQTNIACVASVGAARHGFWWSQLVPFASALCGILWMLLFCMAQCISPARNIATALLFLLPPPRA